MPEKVLRYKSADPGIVNVLKYRFAVMRLTPQVPQIHQTTTKRLLNDSSSLPKRNIERLRLADGKRLMHSKNSEKAGGAICWWDIPTS